jgi:hypothetical protein
MIRVTRLFFGLGLATIVLLGGSSIAHAQYQAPPPGYYAPPPSYGGGYPPPPPPRYRYRDSRSGLTLGGALGVGTISADNCGACGGGLAWEFHIGGMVTPQLAILADLSGVVRSYDDDTGGSSTLTNSLFAVAAQYWIIPILWVKGGIGDAHIALSDYTGDTYGNEENALGFLLAGGVEVVHAPNFALDLQLRLMHGDYSGGGATNYAFLVGVNWY